MSDKYEVRGCSQLLRDTTEGIWVGSRKNFKEHMVPAPELLDTFQAAAVSKGVLFIFTVQAKILQPLLAESQSNTASIELL